MNYEHHPPHNPGNALRGATGETHLLDSPDLRNTDTLIKAMSLNGLAGVEYDILMLLKSQGDEGLTGSDVYEALKGKYLDRELDSALYLLRKEKIIHQDEAGFYHRG